MKHHANKAVTDGDYCHNSCPFLVKEEYRSPWCDLYKWDLDENHEGSFRCDYCFSDCEDDEEI